VKGFRFRGERILEWRRVQADAARGEYLRAAETAREAARFADQAQTAADRAATESLTALDAPVGIEVIERHRIWNGRQRRFAEGCRQTQHEREQAAVEKAALLQVANRHVKVMERLRERAQQRHRELERQLEMKTIDELATQRFAARQQE
jgi:flagellar export protein FliJ